MYVGLVSVMVPTGCCGTGASGTASTVKSARALHGPLPVALLPCTHQAYAPSASATPGATVHVPAVQVTATPAV
ncbi:MAG: hypothetical protein M5R40_16145 [Anaerolineae bacterium]|nr:hypothetical protein [Anaerolineae bacterium]